MGMFVIGLNQCTECEFCGAMVPRYKYNDHITWHYTKGKKKTVKQDLKPVLQKPEIGFDDNNTSLPSTI